MCIQPSWVTSLMAGPTLHPQQRKNITHKGIGILRADSQSHVLEGYCLSSHRSS